LYAGFKQAEGQSRRQLREYSTNFFTSYTLRRAGSWLDGLNLGGGANYRGDAVLGYDITRNNAPIHGGSYVLANAMVGYTIRLKDRQRLRLQLNIDNLLGEDDLIVTDADQVRAYRYVFQNPRRWGLTATYSF
jgi:outer membrane receptor for ferric coprogen and ferric-rhodotorulic acid